MCMDRATSLVALLVAATACRERPSTEEFVRVTVRISDTAATIVDARTVRLPADDLPLASEPTDRMVVAYDDAAIDGGFLLRPEQGYGDLLDVVLVRSSPRLVRIDVITPDEHVLASISAGDIVRTGGFAQPVGGNAPAESPACRTNNDSPSLGAGIGYLSIANKACWLTGTALGSQVTNLVAPEESELAQISAALASVATRPRRAVEVVAIGDLKDSSLLAFTVGRVTVYSQSLFSNDRRLLRANVAHETAHAFTNVLSTGITAAPPLWPQRYLDLGRRNVAAIRMNWSQGFGGYWMDVHNRFAQIAYTTREKFAYPYVDPSGQLRGSGQGAQAATLAVANKADAEDRGFASGYGSMDALEDIASFVEYAAAPGDAHSAPPTVQLCAYLKDRLAKANNRGGNADLRFVVAYTKLNLLRSVGFLSQQMMANCIGAVLPEMKEPDDGIYLYKKDQYQRPGIAMRTDPRRVGWGDNAGANYFKIFGTGTGGQWQMELGLRDPRSLPWGPWILDDTQLNKNLTIRGATTANAFMQFMNRKTRELLQTRQGLVVVTYVQMNGDRISEVRGLVLPVPKVILFGDFLNASQGLNVDMAYNWGTFHGRSDGFAPVPDDYVTAGPADETAPERLPPTPGRPNPNPGVPGPEPPRPSGALVDAGVDAALQETPSR